MAANAKYQPVAARDSLEEPTYSQAPPSYQAEPVVNEPRSEDDNVPEDFKFGGSVAEATLPVCIHSGPRPQSCSLADNMMPYRSACSSSAKSTPS